MKLNKSNSGATAIEYALIIALIALALLSAFAFVGGGVSNTFTAVGSGLSTSQSGNPGGTGGDGGDDGGGGGPVSSCNKNGACTE